MNLPDHLQDGLAAFIAGLEAKKLAEETVRKRRKDIKKFLEFGAASGAKRLPELTQKTVEAYMLDLQRQGLSDNYVEGLLRSTDLFFRYLVDEHRIFASPMAKIKIPTAKLRMGCVLSRDEIDRLIDTPDTSKALGIRDHAILETLYSTGVRSCELLKMTRYSIDFSDGTILVFGKNDKERRVPIGNAALVAIEHYLSVARPRLYWDDRPTDRLWLTRLGTPMQRESLLNTVKTHAAAAGLPSDTTVHAIRRTCATHTLEGGMHPVMLAEFLGHADLTSLAHYLKLSVSKLKEQHNKTRVGK